MRKPNILLITSDQQHYNTLGICNPEIRTPNLDRLARENPSVTVLSDGKQGKVFPHTTQVLVLFGGLLDKITHLTVKCLCQ